MINKIVKYFGTDGLLHIVCCSALTALLGLFLNVWWAVAITALIGLLKEFVYDKVLHKGACQKKDLVADLIGILIGII